MKWFEKHIILFRKTHLNEWKNHNNYVIFAHAFLMQ